MLGSVQPPPAPSHMALRSASTLQHTVLPMFGGIVFQIFASHMSTQHSPVCIQETLNTSLQNGLVLDDVAYQHSVLSMLKAEERQHNGAVIPVHRSLGRL